MNEYWQHIIFGSIVLVVAYIVARILKFFISRYFESSSKSLNVSATNYRFFKNAVNFIVFIAALIVIFYTIPGLKAVGATLLTSAGIFAAILGFASQQAFANIISGVFIVIFKPFRVGDVIQIGNDVEGIVEDITLRHSIITNFQNRRIVIPNSVISSETIINSHIEDEKIQNFFRVGISYDSDLEKAIEVLRDEAMKHPSCIDNRSAEEIANDEPIVRIRVIDLGDSSVDLRAYVWTSDALTGFAMKCDLRETVKLRFDKEGIEIPFPHRTIVYKDLKKASENSTE